MSICRFHRISVFILGAACLIGGLKRPIFAGDDALTFKAFDGKPFFQLQRTETKQKMDFLNQSLQQKFKEELVILWTPKAKKDGNYVVSQKIVGIKTEIDIAGARITYDSTGKNPKSTTTDFFEKMTKSELIYTISPEFKVISVAGRDKFIKDHIDDPLIKAMGDKGFGRFSIMNYAAFLNILSV
jgi:hypothetical protein